MVATYQQSSKLVFDAQAWHRLSGARRRSLMAFAVIAPATALGGPLLAAPAWGDWGWGATGVGILACMALLLLLVRIDADLSGLHPAPAVRAAKPVAQPSAAPVQSLAGARATRRTLQSQASHAFHGVRRRPYRLAH